MGSLNALDKEKLDKALDLMSSAQRQIIDIIERYGNGDLMYDTNIKLNWVAEFVRENGISTDSDMFLIFLKMLNNISLSQIRTDKINKVNDLFIILKDDISKQLDDGKVHNLYIRNKPLLLKLLENNIITLATIKNDAYTLFEFFLPEFLENEPQFVEKYIKNNSQLYNLDSKSVNNPQIVSKEIRNMFHSSDSIAKVIREDDIDTFIQLIEQESLSLTYEVPKSCFETNLMINIKYRNIISYAAVFGALKIFKFLSSKMKKEEFQRILGEEKNLKGAAIIGGNYDIIHLFEEAKLNFANEEEDGARCLIAAIENFHNEIMEYLHVNAEIKYTRRIYMTSIHTFNFMAYKMIIEENPELNDDDYAYHFFFRK